MADQAMRSRCEELVSLCSRHSLTVSTAESCTAGMVASLIADIPGASIVLKGGAVTYCDEIKHRVLGVSQDTLAAYTAVSKQTACEMARGSLDLFGSDVAVSLTGYAGPGGGTEADPAGTVYLGIARRDGLVHGERCIFSGSRNEVRCLAAAHAVELLIEHCMEIAGLS